MLKSKIDFENKVFARRNGHSVGEYSELYWSYCTSNGRCDLLLLQDFQLWTHIHLDRYMMVLEMQYRQNPMLAK